MSLIQDTCIGYSTSIISPVVYSWSDHGTRKRKGCATIEEEEKNDISHELKHIIAWYMYICTTQNISVNLPVHQSKEMYMWEQTCLEDALLERCHCADRVLVVQMVQSLDGALTSCGTVSYAWRLKVWMTVEGLLSRPVDVIIWCESMIWV